MSPHHCLLSVITKINRGNILWHRDETRNANTGLIASSALQRAARLSFKVATASSSVSASYMFCLIANSSLRTTLLFWNVRNMLYRLNCDFESSSEKWSK